MFDPVVRTGPVIAVARLAFEARIAAGPGVMVLFGKGLDKINSIVEAGAKGIISFGVAGGLTPDLAAGDWVVASRVVTAGVRIPTDRLWSERLLSALPSAVYADVSGVDAPMAGEDAKRRLLLSAGTAAVDTESHIVAKIAAAYGVPFAVCRVIVDGLDRPLPPAVLAALRLDGTINFSALLRSLSHQPKQLPALVRLICDAHIARRALIRGRKALSAELSFPTDEFHGAPP